jgi:hypothetical protein
MKNHKKLFQQLSVLLLFFIFSSLFGCSGPRPETSVELFFDNIRSGNHTEAAAYTEKGNTLVKYENKQQEKLANLVFSNVYYEIISCSVQGETAIIKAKVTAPDLSITATKMVADLLPKFLTLSFANLPNIDEISERMVIEYFQDNLNTANVSTITTDVQLSLVKNKNKVWVIKESAELRDAITGNLAKAFSSLDQLVSSGHPMVTPDDNLHPVGEEGKIGKAAITVTTVEKSNGTENDRPKDGMEYIIVSIREKNLGPGNIIYNPYFFKMVNSKGQITAPTYTSVNKNTNLESGDLDVGEEVKGTLVFEQPKGDNYLILLFESTGTPLLKYSIK